MIFRAFRESDAPVILSWFQNERDFRKWTATQYGPFPIPPEEMILRYAQGQQSGCFYPMTLTEENGKVIGHLILRSPGEEGTIRLGYVAVDHTLRGRGIGKQLVLLATEYAFRELGARMCDLGVFTNNPAAYACYIAAGFRENGSSCTL